MFANHQNYVMANVIYIAVLLRKLIEILGIHDKSNNIAQYK